jgi:ABC-type nitrate/sulfonate/bicarbonate transport system substrate-binding protein
MTYTRRRFLTSASLAGAAGLFRAAPAQPAESALETTSVRLSKTPSICIAPQYIADKLLRAEGFTDVRYVDLGQNTPRAQAIAHGTVDFSANFVAPLIVAVSAAEPLTFLAGVHVSGTPPRPLLAPLGPRLCSLIWASHGAQRLRRLSSRSSGDGSVWCGRVTMWSTTVARP